MSAVILLFFAAMALILAEFFLPGGVLGVIGVLTLIASIVLGWLRFPEYGFLIAVGELVGTVLCVVLGIRLIAKTGARRAFVLEGAQTNEEGYTSPIETHAPIGTIAPVHSALRPAGSIMVNGYRVDAVSDGTFIDAGKLVRVVDVAGNRIVVEEVEDENEGQAG
jgi:membrane-bound serine protease (ClpP class)